MPALERTGFKGRLVWLGTVPDREADLRSHPITECFAGFAGLDGEAHGGLTRASCSRVTTQYPRGTEIRNTRQICILSQEELDGIAAAIGVAEFDPAWAGASLVIEGLPDFTHIPPSSRLQFSAGTTLTVDMENRPCHLPAAVIDIDQPGRGKAFKQAARDRRGVTAWVEREGMLHVGDEVVLHVPAQRAWQPDS